jgi:transcriptional regulator with XRE-family HTH domain
MGLVQKSTKRLMRVHICGLNDLYTTDNRTYKNRKKEGGTPLNDNAAGGRELRRLRLRYGVTLQDAAARMTMSPSLLSRKERGTEEIRRDDIRSAISAYSLTPREAVRVWLAAGFVPEHAPASFDNSHLASYARHTLAHLALPAILVDAFWYIRVWTHDVEAMWALNSMAGTDIHMVDSLFVDTLRKQQGMQWHSYAAHMMRFFWQGTLPVVGMPEFRDMLYTLRRRYGEAFVQTWNRAHQKTQNSLSLATLAHPATVQYQSAYGTITYTVATGMLALPPPYEIIVYIPYDAESLERYQHVRAALGPGYLHYRL